MAILSKQASRIPRGSKAILYIDGFAGPGVYEKGEPGSPLIAIEAALRQPSLPVPIRCLFVEKDKPRYQHLCAEIAKRQSELDANPRKIQVAPVRNDDCTSVLTEVLQRSQSLGSFGPALVFLDQFGYSEIPIELIAGILKWPACEVFSYLNYNQLHPYLTDPTKEVPITRAYGSDEWKAAIPLAGPQRQRVLFDAYERALKQKAGAKYVLAFAMHDSTDRLLYWLFFCTGHLAGIREMKEAMEKVDDTLRFRFSDADNPDQFRLFAGYTQDWLAADLSKRLSGKALTIDQVDEFVLLETPCRLFKKALVSLEKAGKLVPVNAPLSRKPCTFPDPTMTVRFL